MPEAVRVGLQGFAEAELVGPFGGGGVKRYIGASLPLAGLKSNLPRESDPVGKSPASATAWDLSLVEGA